MKRHLYRILSCLFAASIFVAQGSMARAQDDVGVVQGRVVNVRDPIGDQDAATKNYVDNLIDGIPEPPAVLQSTGKSETAVMSQSAVTNAIDAAHNALSSQLNENGIPVVTTTGTASALVATVPDWDVTVGKMMVIVPHVTGISNAVTLNVNNDGAKTFTCTDSSGSSGGFASSAPIVTAGTPVLIVRGASQWNVLNISKPNVNSVNGVLSIANGGTGSSTNTGAVSNLGITFASGTWTPVLVNHSGTNPTYTVSGIVGYWRRISYGDFNLMFIAFSIDANITNVGNTSGYALISGLPRTCCTDTTSISYEACNNLTGSPNKLSVFGGTSVIIPRTTDGLTSVRWQTGETYIRAAGCYICSAS